MPLIPIYFRANCRLRQRVPPHVLGQASDHNLRADRHPADAALPLHHRRRVSPQLPALVRQTLRNRHEPAEAPVSLRQEDPRPSDPLPDPGAGLHLLRSAALQPAGELVAARGLVLLLHVARYDRVRRPGARAAARRGSVLVRLLGVHPDRHGAGGHVLQPGAGRDREPAAVRGGVLCEAGGAPRRGADGRVLTAAQDGGRQDAAGAQEAAPRHAAQQPAPEDAEPLSAEHSSQEICRCVLLQLL